MPAISSRVLPATDVSVTTLSLGTAALGNLFRPVTDEDATAVVQTALDAGIGYVDTAPHYGLGLAEARVGRALSSTAGPRPTVSTKVGRLLLPLPEGDEVDGEGYVDTPRLRRVWDLSEAGIRTSLEESLKRLGLDRVDMLYLHDPDNHETEALTEALPALLRLREEGLVGAVGAGMNQSAMPARFVQETEIDVVLLAGRYTLLDQTGLADLLPLCEARGVSVIVGGAFNSGLLVDPAPGATFDYATASAPLVARAQQLQALCAGHGVPLTAAALQFPLAHPAVVSVLNGPRSVAELQGNLTSFTTEIPAALWHDVRAAGLVADDAPLPGGA